MKIICNG